MIKKIYISIDSTNFIPAKSLAIKLGWVGQLDYKEEPWIVIDTHYKKAYYTFQPPLKGIKSIAIDPSIKVIQSTLSKFELERTTTVVDPRLSDPYNNTLILVIDPNL